MPVKFSEFPIGAINADLELVGFNSATPANVQVSYPDIKNDILASATNIYNANGTLSATTRTISYNVTAGSGVENKLVLRNLTVTGGANNDFIFQAANNTGPVLQIWNPNYGGSFSFGGNGTISFGSGRLNLSTSAFDIAFLPSGVERVRFFTTGNVAIGSTTDNGSKLQVTGQSRFGGVGNGTCAIFDNGITVNGGITLGEFTFAPYMSITQTSTTTQWGTTSFGGNNLIAGHPGILITSAATGRTFSYGSVISGGGTGVWATYRYFYDDVSLVMQYSASAITQVASSMLTLNSTTKGFLPPRMTTAQKNAIGTPAAGLVVYDTDLNKLCVFTTAWQTITSV